MEAIRQIVEHVAVMAPVLTSIKWEPFRQDAILEFSDESEHLRVRLNGIHLLASRQLPAYADAMSLPDENDVEYFDVFDVSDDSPFLREFIAGRVFSPAEIVLYDTHHRTVKDSSFTKPVHVLLSSTDGVLDVICEEVDLVS